MRAARKKCYIYTRVSTTAQTEGYSLEAQQERLRAHAQYMELEIAGEYCDAGRSGKDIKGRPAFQQMIEDILCQKDEVSFVLVFKLSRFGRNAADIMSTLQLLMDCGIDLVCVEDAIDSSTQGGRLTLAILSAVAEIERENISSQFMSGRMQKLREGKWPGGPAPYGYRNVQKELQIVPEEAVIVRKIFDLYLEGNMLVTTIVGYLNENGYTRGMDRTGKPKPVTNDFVRHILNNPVYCGMLAYGRRTNKKDREGHRLRPDPEQVVLSQGVHTPIVTEEEWEQVRKKREKHSSWGKKTHETGRISLLSGLIRCPMCGSGMIATTNRQINKNHGGHYKTGHYYACGNAKKGRGKTCAFRHTYRQEKVDSAVFEVVQKLGLDPEFRETIRRNVAKQQTGREPGQDSKESLEEQMHRARKKLREGELSVRRLGEQLDHLDFSNTGYNEKYSGIQKDIDHWYDVIEKTEEEIAEIRSRMEGRDAGIRTAENIERMLDHFQKLYRHMSCQEKRRMYRLFIDRIEVFPEEREDKKILKSITFRFSGLFENSKIEQEMLSAVLHGEDCRSAVSCTMDCSRQELTAAETKATYAEIKQYVLERHGLKVSSLYIAQVKRKYGLEVGVQYHKAADPGKKVPVCPAAKEAAIKEALLHFKMISDPGSIKDSKDAAG